MNDEPTKLRQFIIEHYNLEEIKTLCFRLVVNYDSLSGDQIETKSRELILHILRQERIPDLLAVLKKDHPGSFARANLSEDPIFLEEALVKADSVSPSDICLYCYDNQRSNSVEMHYLGKETIKDVCVWKIYADKEGIEHRDQVKQFFSRQDLGMWGHHVPVNVMQKNDVVRFHLVGEDRTLDRKATVQVVFTDTQTGKTLIKQQEFELKR